MKILLSLPDWLTTERRARIRTSYDQSLTGLIEALLRDPAGTAGNLEEDLEFGADPQMILTLLNTAESLTRLRGLEIGTTVEAIRKRILRRIGPSVRAVA